MRAACGVANRRQWSPTRTNSIATLPVGCCTYSTSFCPSNPAIISAVGADSHLRIFDLRTPASAKYHLTATVPVHAAPPGIPGHVPAVGPGEVLTHDWNKYNHSVIATGGVDKLLRTFDIRNPGGGPLSLMEGHRYAVRKVAWSPHESDVLISAAYDMSVRVWTDGSKYPVDPTMPVLRGKELGLMNRHTEFATGVDWCLFGQGWVASVGWDERVLLWDSRPFLLNR